MRQNIFLFLVMSGSSLFFCSSLSFHLPKRRKGGQLSNRIQDVTTMTTSNDLSQLEFIQDVGINQEDASSSIRVSEVGRRERFVTCVRKTLKKHRMNVALAVSFSSMVSCRTAFAIESPNISYSNKASIPAVPRAVKSVVTNNKMAASKTQDNRDSLTKSISTKVIVPSVPVMISAGAGYSYILKKKRKQNNVEFIAIEDLETERKVFVKEVDTIIENATHIGNKSRGENNSVNGWYRSKMNTNVNGDTNDAVYTTTCVDPKSTRPNESCDDITNTISYEPKANNEIRNDVTDSYVEKVSELSSSIIDESGSTIIDDPIDSHFEDPQHLSENQKIEDNPTSICSNTSPIPLLLDDDDDETVKETAWFEQALSSPEGESIRKLFENDNDDKWDEVKAVEEALFEEFSRSQKNRMQKQAEEYEIKLKQGEDILKDINDALYLPKIWEEKSNEVGNSPIQKQTFAERSNSVIEFDEFMEDLNKPQWNNEVPSFSDDSISVAASDKKKKTADAASAILTLGAVGIGLEFMSIVDIVLTTPLVFAGAKALTDKYMRKRNNNE